jgi:nitroimidazol reductase NimA-like FMN-containing flavoprotein (pyridoxamine 5'-phosphate oxidase superfamily)
VPRENIKMTPAELRSFLASSATAVLATIDRDGTPWTDLVAYRLIGDRLHFQVPSGSRSWVNIQADPRVCCVVEHSPADSYYGIQGALVHGEAVEPTSAERAEEAAAFDGLTDPVQPGGTGAILLSIGLEDSTSFAFSKIRYRYEHKSLAELGGGQ